MDSVAKLQTAQRNGREINRELAHPVNAVAAALATLHVASKMLGAGLLSVPPRTAEDEDIDEDRYYAKKQRAMERRIARRRWRFQR